MSVSVAVLGLAAHATQFVALFAVPGLLLLWNALTTGRRRTFFFSGLLLGLAFMMKQPGACFGLFALVMMTWQAIQKRSLFTRDFLLTLSGFSAGMFLPFGIFCLAALVSGDFGRFWFWTFDYSRYYAVRGNVSRGWQHLRDYVSGAFPAYGGLWLLAALGLPAALRATQSRKKTAFVLVLFFFSLLATLPGLNFPYHYFIVLLPAFALLLGLGIEELAVVFSRWRMQLVPSIALVIALAASIYVQRQVFFQLTPRQVIRLSYEGNPFIESQPLAQYIRDHSKTDALVAVMGSEPQIYFYANRHSATGYIYTYPMMEKHPYASMMQKDMIKEIETAKPEFLVQVAYPFSWLKLDSSDLTILKWVESYTRQFYIPVAAVGLRADGQIVSASGADMPKLSGSLQQALILFQRRTDLN
jgi:hypothetical protein